MSFSLSEKISEEANAELVKMMGQLRHFVEGRKSDCGQLLGEDGGNVKILEAKMVAGFRNEGLQR